MPSTLISDKLNNYKKQIEEINLDKNSEWFKVFPYDADLRTKYADDMENKLSTMFEQHLNNNQVLTRDDFFFLYLAWLSYVTFVNYGNYESLEQFEKDYKIDVVERAKQYSKYAMNSEQTRKFNDYVLYGHESEDTATEDEPQADESNDVSTIEDIEDISSVEDAIGDITKLDLAKIAVIVAVIKRAQDMARTETNVLANELLHYTAKALYKSHEWVSERDNRVRKTHQIADGQIRPIDKPFSVGKYEMYYPGDTSLGAGAEEIVLCRCHEEFHDPIQQKLRG